MTLGELIDRASHEPVEVRESRRRAVCRRMARVTRRQLDRELLELGAVDLGGESGGA